MEWLYAHASEIGTMLGGLAGVFAFLQRLDKTYRRQLRDEFATKQDFRELRQDVREIRRAVMGADYIRPVRKG